MKPILARKSKNTKGCACIPWCKGWSARARTHPLANSFIETKFPICSFPFLFSHFVFTGNFCNNFGIISIEFVSQNSSLRLTWKNYILQLYFFLTNKVSAKNNSQQQEYISRGILLSSDRIFEIFWLRTKKNVTSPLSCTKNSHPYEKSTWGGKKSLRVFTHHPSGSQSQDSCLF